MVKSQFVFDLSDGVVADSLFMVSEVGLKSFNSREGSFLQLQLMDKTGTITSICWEPELLDFHVELGQVIRVRGIVRDHKSFGQQMIFKPESVSLVKEYDLGDFMRKTKKDVGQMLAYLAQKTEGISNPYLKQLVKIFFDDPAFLERFRDAPCAKFYHHNFVGGLLEHTCNVVRDCEVLSLQYNVDNDLLIAGAILHDLGKLEEYGQKPLISMTDRGGLAGHLVLGCEMLNFAIGRIEGFPQTLKLKMEHIILSHHMKPEYGAVQRPKFLEAFCVAHADFMDARVAAFCQNIEEISPDESDGSWHMHKNLKYYVYLK